MASKKKIRAEISKKKAAAKRNLKKNPGAALKKAKADVKKAKKAKNANKGKPTRKERLEAAYGAARTMKERDAIMKREQQRKTTRNKKQGEWRAARKAAGLSSGG